MRVINERDLMDCSLNPIMSNRCGGYRVLVIQHHEVSHGIYYYSFSLVMTVYYTDKYIT